MFIRDLDHLNLIWFRAGLLERIFATGLAYLKKLQLNWIVMLLQRFNRIMLKLMRFYYHVNKDSKNQFKSLKSGYLNLAMASDKSLVSRDRSTSMCWKGQLNETSIYFAFCNYKSVIFFRWKNCILKPNSFVLFQFTNQIYRIETWMSSMSVWSGFSSLLTLNSCFGPIK